MSNSTVSGTLQQWHKITIDFDGPLAQETAATFRNYRLDVTFTNTDTGTTLIVPGFFAADGDAADTSASAGTVWRVHFAPPESGNWTYSASFRSGTDVAVSLDPNAGTPVASIDGETGSFAVATSDKTGEDLRAKGALTYDGDHYLTFAGSGENLIKSGVGGPENFLDYAGFDNTPVDVHHFNAHLGDWSQGDPTWGADRGKEIIGAINYLADAGVNSFWVMVNTVGGDTRSVWPWAATNLNEIPRGSTTTGSGGTFNIPAGFEDAFSSFDVSKLAQWGVVFEHMQERGIVVHMVLQERENDQLLNNGALGVERMLYLRELIARFGHNNGVIYNFGEENTNTYANLQAMSDYIRAVDAYDRPLAYHILEFQQITKYGDLTASGIFDVYSNHNWLQDARDSIDLWYGESEDAGRPMPSYWDEQYNGGIGLRDDSDPAQQADMRAGLWGTLTVGGAGVEWLPGTVEDKNWNDFSNRADAFRWTLAARVLFEQLPVDQMSNADSATSGTVGTDYVFSLPGEIYVIYLPDGGSATLNLAGIAGSFDVDWYNPRTGGLVEEGSVTTVSGGGQRNLGTPPSDPDEDWAILVRRAGQYRLEGIDADAPGNTPPILAAPSAVDVTENATAVTTVSASDADGDTVTFSITGGADRSLFAIDASSGALSFLAAPDFEVPGDSGGNNVYNVTVTASDGNGGSDSQAIAVTVTNDPGDDPPPGALPIDVFLVDADTDQIVSALADGTELQLAAIAGRPLSIFAVVPSSSPLAGQVKSVVLDFEDGQAVRTENASPYALFGDDAGDFAPGLSLDTGSFSIDFDLYSASGGKGTLLDQVAITFSVANDGSGNAPPVFTSPTNYDIAENTTAVATVSASDADGDAISYSITGGADRSRFAIDASSGALSFLAAPDFEIPGDAGGNNVYDVTVTASDGNGGSDSQSIAVTVINDPDDDPPPGALPIDVFLVDTDTDQVVAALSDGAAIDLGQTSASSFSIFALVPGSSPLAGQVGSMVLDFENGQAVRTENAAPYALFGDSGGDFFGGTALADAAYSIDFAIFSGSGGRGTLLDEVSIAFTIFNADTGGSPNTPPEITGPAAVDIVENTTAVADFAGFDADGDTLSFAIAGGDDAGAFTINAATGALAFASLPNFENAADVDGDNVYDVVVSVSDGADLDTQAVVVSVTDDPDEPDLPVDVFLVDPDTDQVIAQLDDGMVLAAADLAGRSLSIYVEVPDTSPLFGQVESMVLDFGGGQVVRTENSEPYALFGDTNGDFFGGFTLDAGSYDLAIEAYSADKAAGTLVDSIILGFDLV